MTSLTLASNGGSWLGPILAPLAPATCRVRFLPPRTEGGRKEDDGGGREGGRSEVNTSRELNIPVTVFF